MANNCALKKTKTKSRQDLTLFEESDIEEDCSLVSKEEHGIERSRAEQEAAEPKEEEYEDLDILCLEAACRDVLHTFWCVIKMRASDFGVPERALRAMVETAFLKELDEALFFMDEENKPLTRAKFLRVLMDAERRQAESEENVTHPYRVPQEKWDELKRKARGGLRASTDLIESRTNNSEPLFKARVSMGAK